MNLQENIRRINEMMRIDESAKSYIDSEMDEIERAVQDLSRDEDIDVSVKDVNFKELTITVETLLGEEVFTLNDSNNGTDYTIELNLENLSDGIYNLKVTTEAGTTISKLAIQ